MKFRMMLALVLATAGFSAYAETSVKVLMRQKLEGAHGVLEALPLADFGKIEHFAEQLRNVSRATSWHRPDSEEFQLFAKSFQNSADFLAERAKEKDLEGVSMGYIRLTLDCLRCHDALRPAKRGK